MNLKKIVLPLILLTACSSSNMSLSNLSEQLEPLKVLNVEVYEGYASYPVRAYFGNQPIISPDLYYEIDDNSIAQILDNKVIPLMIGTTNVLASTSDGRETNFIVRVKSMLENRFNADVLSRIEEFELTHKPAQNPTVFIGDSFFDPRNFWRSFYDDFDGLNCFAAGISSSKASDWIHFRDRLIHNFAPKQIVIHIGTNDINDNEIATLKVADYYHQITSFLELLITELPGVAIYYLGIENRSATSGYNHKNIYVEQVTNLIKTEFGNTYQQQFHYIDTPTTFNGNQSTYLASDGIHPSNIGYQFYVELLKGVINF